MCLLQYSAELSLPEHCSGEQILYANVIYSQVECVKIQWALNLRIRRLGFKSFANGYCDPEQITYQYFEIVKQEESSSKIKKTI